jgi:hypothetical protein
MAESFYRETVASVTSTLDAQGPRPGVKRLLLNETVSGLVRAALSNGTVRYAIMRAAEARVYERFVKNKKFPKRVQEDKFYLARSLLYAAGNALKRGSIAPSVQEALIKNLVGKIILGTERVRQRYKDRYGFAPPSFLTISPTKSCNLRCTGCYATSSGSCTETLPYRIVSRIIFEKTKMWGSHFTVSGGREDSGYFYINWDGEVTPCVFVPYSGCNIIDVYNRGGSLNDVLSVPFFEAIRKWQKSYVLDRNPYEVGNMISPCPFRDHHELMHSLILEYNAKPIDEEAEAALWSRAYVEQMKRYGGEIEKITADIWQREYIKPPQTQEGS